MNVKRPLIASPGWTVDEEEQLRSLLKNDEHPASIGKLLKRSEGAIRHRMTKLGLRPKRGKRQSVAAAPSVRMQAFRDSVSADARAKK